jgi:hypothetical protein
MVMGMVAGMLTQMAMTETGVVRLGSSKTDAREESDACLRAQTEVRARRVNDGVSLECGREIERQVKLRRLGKMKRGDRKKAEFYSLVPRCTSTRIGTSTTPAWVPGTET